MSHPPAPYGYGARFAALVALFVKQPRTRREVQLLLGIYDRRSVEAHIGFLCGEGLLYIKEWRMANLHAKPKAVYAWQPGVCEMPDAPEPRVARRRAVVYDQVSLQP